MKKLSKKDETVICNSYRKNKKNIKQLASEYEVASSTISRILQKYDQAPISKVRIGVVSEDVKRELGRTLLGLGISNPNFIILELSNKFNIELRQKEEVQIFEVTEWEE